jgi:nucleoid DNA-binding protein
VTYDELVDKVTERTKGTEGDPLTREEVEQIVNATLMELGAGGPSTLEDQP